MRLANRIYSLHLQSKDEVIYTYQRVFKYLLEMLKTEEFERLSFYSVNRLIDTVFQTKGAVAEELLTLRQFIYKALDLNYLQSDKSNKLLHADERIKHYFAQNLWTSCKGIVVGNEYVDKQFKRKNPILLGNLGMTSDAKVFDTLETYISKRVRVHEAPEQVLPQIMNRSHLGRTE